MEIAIIKRETTGSGPVNVFTENETIAKYEIMDGAPVKGNLNKFNNSISKVCPLKRNFSISNGYKSIEILLLNAFINSQMACYDHSAISISDECNFFEIELYHPN